MEFGQIIKKAWAITWRYRYLWVLGLFAGVTGPAGGGGSTGSGGRSFGTGSGSTNSSSPFSGAQMDRFAADAQHWLPIVVAVVVVSVLVGLLFFLLGLAAKGGLVWAVNEIEEGRAPSLGDGWGQGFKYMWRVFGLGILLSLPVLVLLLVIGVLVVLPLVGALAAGGGRAALAAIVPVCGVLIIGVPLLIVLSFVLGIMQVVALRRIVLDGGHVFDSAREAWTTFRSRFKDTALMWLINWGLNLVAGLVIAIPIVLITLAFGLPAVFAAAAGGWGTFAAFAAVWLVVVVILSFVFNAIWGTFTSSLWTIFYRRLTGREVVAHSQTPAPPAYAGAPPVAPAYPGAAPQQPYSAAPGAPAAYTAPAPVPPGPPMAPVPPEPAPPASAPAPQPPQPPSAFDPHVAPGPTTPPDTPDA